MACRLTKCIAFLPVIAVMCLQPILCHQQLKTAFARLIRIHEALKILAKDKYKHLC